MFLLLIKFEFDLLCAIKLNLFNLIRSTKLSSNTHTIDYYLLCAYSLMPSDYKLHLDPVYQCYLQLPVSVESRLQVLEIAHLALQHMTYARLQKMCKSNNLNKIQTGIECE